MYNAYFGFSENPFSLSPDPAFLYRSEQHEEALANLIYGVQSRKGFIVLSGEVGTGKTTMLECLRDFLGAVRVELPGGPAGGPGPDHGADRRRSAQPGVGSAGRDPLARQHGKPAWEI